MSTPFTGEEGPVMYAERLGYSVVYLRFGKVAHFARFSAPGMDRLALCMVHPRWPWSWLGTGTQDEIDRAEALPLCTRCLERLVHIRLSDTRSWVEDGR